MALVWIIKMKNYRPDLDIANRICLITSWGSDSSCNSKRSLNCHLRRFRSKSKPSNNHVHFYRKKEADIYGSPSRYRCSYFSVNLSIFGC